MTSSDSAPPSASALAIGLADIEQAAARLTGYARETPLIESTLLNQRLGRRVLVKAECLQRTGSFKFRGAYNRLAALTPEVRSRGVVAFSSGNHAQGIAAAAQFFDIPATIVMPKDAPSSKIKNVRSYGAEIRFHDRERDDRAAMARAIASENGATLVPPYDDPYVIAGQGTIGLEVARQANQMGIIPDAMIICCSGGGLAAGIGTAMAAHYPGIKLYTAEPALFDDTARSLVGTEPAFNTVATGSICDALMARTPGEMTLPILRRYFAGGLTAEDSVICRAMRAAFEDLRMIAEPGGAAALAALMTAIEEDRLPAELQVIVVILSGGNVDPALYASIIAD
jgi:threonine dehydratase